jgi:hypothetical protein
MVLGEHSGRFSKIIVDFPRVEVEAMRSRFPATCNLRWLEFLSPEEIRNWFNSQQIRRRLLTELNPGVYRFIFPEARDANSAHTPCYVGEAGKIRKRLRNHFQLERHGTADKRRLRFTTMAFQDRPERL